MSILIKGMEMPTDCIFCPMFHGAWTICAGLNKTTSVKGRPDDCPLVPVPPHGDLIDRQALLKLIEDPEDVGWVGYIDALDITCAPTIIEAEEGKT